MKPVSLLFVLVASVLCLQLVACGPPATAGAAAKAATVEHLEGDEPTRLTLTEEAITRIDLQTVKVGQGSVGGAELSVIPYAALIYDTEGKTWTYLNKAPQTFVRHAVIVKHIEGDKVFLTDKLDSDSLVVTTGAAELFGSESEFEEE